MGVGAMPEAGRPPGGIPGFVPAWRDWAAGRSEKVDQQLKMELNFE
jgi:hypothetical protein